ncbi:hypothetical protein QYF36_022627 [Acer negundo]|nr:hypothetical protein QYF36_022627 [Acer negundo]
MKDTRSSCPRLGGVNQWQSRGLATAGKECCYIMSLPWAWLGWPTRTVPAIVPKAKGYHYSITSMEPSSFTELALLRQGRGWRFRTSLNELSSRKYLDRNVKEGTKPAQSSITHIRLPMLEKAGFEHPNFDFLPGVVVVIDSRDSML